MSPADVFINYRTSDEASSAALIEEKLSQRFGTDRIFRDHKSIRAGEQYPQKLLSGIRRCSVLLVVVGPEWANARNERDERRLDDPDDWTRREIVEALDCGLHVIPVLVAPRTSPLKPSELPEALAGLAELQYRQFNARTFAADVASLGDDLAQLVPQLGNADRDAIAGPGPTAGAARNSVQDVRGSAVQTDDYTHHQSGGIGNLNGSVGAFFNSVHGQVHSGTGNQYNGSAHHTGDGDNHVSGDSRGDIQPEFRARRKHEDREEDGR